MPSNMQLLQLEPENILQFNKTPMTSSPNRMLKLTNPSSGHVAFKVKTTAPKAYLVRPSSGTLKPNGQQEVQIILQPQNSADANTNSHRFLVQAVPVQNGEAVTREQWQEFQKEIIQEQRLSVLLEEQQAEATINPPIKGTTAAEGAKGGTTAIEQPGDLKVKYDELVQYTLMLEKDKKKLEVELAESRSAKGTGASDSGSCDKLQVVVVAALGFLLAYLPKLIFEKGA